uniref:CBFD_NFYB_HMF domain-containing protein n=1 Tax=Strongyloides venezuelensis TaxID=75913 RepID=A0A0K0G1W7_STRVS
MEPVDLQTTVSGDKPEKVKVTGQQTIFPLARIKKIAKHIPNVTLIAPEVVTAMGYVTEKFIEILAEEAFRNAAHSGKKTVTRKDIDAVIASSLPFQILEGCIDDLEELDKLNTMEDDVVGDNEDNDIEVMEGSNDNNITTLEEEPNSSVETNMDIDVERKIFVFKCRNCRKLNVFFSCILSVNSYCKFCSTNCDNGFALYKIVISPFFIYTIGCSRNHFKYGILIKPSRKSFYDYSFNDSLHIGVVDEENGIVFSFWSKGIVKEYASVEWKGSVKAFSVIRTKNPKSMEEFFASCENFFRGSMYDCNTWNCFDFVLAFLNFYGYPLVSVTKEVFTKKSCVTLEHMAEFLESDGNDDNDRLMDRKSFNREQFRLFKEAFRDSVEVREDVEYDDNVSVFDYVPSAKKKRIINLIMKIEKLGKSTSDNEVREKASDLLKQLRESASLIPSTSDELEPDDLDLKKFDETDISLFLGGESEGKEGKAYVSEALSKYKEKSLQELESLLKESEIFLKCNKNPK